MFIPTGCNIEQPRLWRRWYLSSGSVLDRTYTDFFYVTETRSQMNVVQKRLLAQGVTKTGGLSLRGAQARLGPPFDAANAVVLEELTDCATHENLVGVQPMSQVRLFLLLPFILEACERTMHKRQTRMGLTARGGLWRPDQWFLLSSQYVPTAPLSRLFVDDVPYKATGLTRAARVQTLYTQRIRCHIDCRAGAPDPRNPPTEYYSPAAQYCDLPRPNRVPTQRFFVTPVSLSTAPVSMPELYHATPFNDYCCFSDDIARRLVLCNRQRAPCLLVRKDLVPRQTYSRGNVLKMLHLIHTWFGPDIAVPNDTTIDHILNTMKLHGNVHMAVSVPQSLSTTPAPSPAYLQQSAQPLSSVASSSSSLSSSSSPTSVVPRTFVSGWCLMNFIRITQSERRPFGLPSHEVYGNILSVVAARYVVDLKEEWWWDESDFVRALSLVIDESTALRAANNNGDCAQRLTYFAGPFSRDVPLEAFDGGRWVTFNTWSGSDMNLLYKKCYSTAPSTNATQTTTSASQSDDHIVGRFDAPAASNSPSTSRRVESDSGHTAMPDHVTVTTAMTSATSTTTTTATDPDSSSNVFLGVATDEEPLDDAQRLDDLALLSSMGLLPPQHPFGTEEVSDVEVAQLDAVGVDARDTVSTPTVTLSHASTSGNSAPPLTPPLVQHMLSSYLAAMSSPLTRSRQETAEGWLGDLMTFTL